MRQCRKVSVDRGFGARSAGFGLALRQLVAALDQRGGGHIGEAELADSLTPPAELDTVLSHLSLPPSVNIYAIFYDEKGQEVYPERDVISSQYSSGSLSVDTIIIWHTDQLFPN